MMSLDAYMFQFCETVMILADRWYCYYQTDGAGTGKLVLVILGRAQLILILTTS